MVVAEFEGPGLAEATSTNEIGHQVYAPADSTTTPTSPTPAPAAPSLAAREGATAARLLNDQPRRPRATKTLEIAPRRELESGAHGRGARATRPRGIALRWLARWSWLFLWRSCSGGFERADRWRCVACAGSELAQHPRATSARCAGHIARPPGKME